MVDWDRYRRGFGGGWAVSWFVQCNAGSLQCQSNFLPLGDFVLLLIFFRICRNGRQHDKKEEVIEMALHAACPF